jgi:hypothetical protein
MQIIAHLRRGLPQLRLRSTINLSPPAYRQEMQANRPLSPITLASAKA